MVADGGTSSLNPYTLLPA